MAMKLRCLAAGVLALLASFSPAGAQTQPNLATGIVLPCAAGVPWLGGSGGANTHGQCASGVLGTFAYQSFTAPPAIGGVTPAAGTFTTLIGTNTTINGTLTAGNLTTSGTIGGTLCATSAGLVLYKSGVNCFAGTATSITTGTTTVASGTTGYLLYDNAGVLGEETIASILTAGSGISITGTTNATIGMASLTANRLYANFTSSTAAPVSFAMPSCADSGSNHLNYVNGTGITCGTAIPPLASVSANQVVANFTGSGAVPAGFTMPSCADTAGNHLNYVNGTGITCGTSTSGVTQTSSTWSPTQTGFSVVGGVSALTGTYVKTGTVVYITVHFQAGTSITSSGTGQFTNLPFAVGQNGAICSAADADNGNGIGAGGYAASTTLFLPPWSATANVQIACTYQST